MSERRNLTIDSAVHGRLAQAKGSNDTWGEFLTRFLTPQRGTGPPRPHHNGVIRRRGSRYDRADLRPVFQDVKSIYLEHESYQPHSVRQQVDDDVFRDLTTPAFSNVLRTECGLEIE
jgi:hypothetical protein